MINRTYFEKEFGINYLRIEVSLKELNSISNLSKQISIFLDENDHIDSNYYIDVFSPGTDTSFDPKESRKFIGKNVKVKLLKSINGIAEFIGELLSCENNEIIVRWNAKGQFRKQNISIDDIEKINIYAKL